MSFEIWIFRDGQPDRDDDRILFVGITYTLELSRQQLNSVQEITLLGTSSRITYELLIVNSIRWCCWNIAIDKKEVDCWKSHHVSRIVLFLIFLRCRFQGEGQCKEQAFDCQ